MRRIVCMMACAALMLTLAACGSQEAAPEKSTETQKPVESTEPAQEEKKETAQEPEPAGSAFEQYEAALNEKGISFEKVQMAAEIVGAIEGAKYKIDGGAVELYLFDADSEAYMAAEEKQALTMEGFGDFKATVENGMAFFVSDLESEPYLEIFRSLTLAE